MASPVYQGGNIVGYSQGGAPGQVQTTAGPASGYAASAPEAFNTNNSAPTPSPSQGGSQGETKPQSTPQNGPPQANLQPGSQGQNVQQLQQYLAQMGYLTPQQISTGQGTYGPQTTAAVAQLQKDLGVNPGTSSGTYGPKTQQALAQKYQGIFGAVGNTKTPDSGAAAGTQIQSYSQASPDPVFGALVSSMQPIMDSLTQVLNNINNPALTAVSLQQEYNNLQQQYGLPQMQADMLNMQNVMRGTDLDIRDEITKAGGTATESQVMGLTSARNTVILRQYNALATQYQAAQTNVTNLMQYAATDQQTALARQNATASVTENMASIEAQMVTMGMNMQQNAKQAVQYNVTQTGYTALAASTNGNPKMLSYYENMLNLAPGTLSNPSQLSALDTYRQQQLAIAAENAKNAGMRTYIYGQSQGIPTPSPTGTQPGTGTTFGTGTTSSFTIPPNSLTRPSWLDANVPLYMSSSDAQQFLSSNPKNVTVGGTTSGTSSSGNNFDVQGVGHYIAQPDGSYILGSALPSELSTPQGVGGLITSLGQPNPPTLNYSDIAAIMQNSPGSKYPPASTAFYREQRSARQLLGNFTGSPVYATVSQAPLPFARIQAARNGDNSVSDTELLDSYITLAKGQGQITEAQIAAITGASSISDKLNIIKQKVSGAGALISADQRKSLLALSGSVFDQYSSQYKNLYTQAINVLSKNHMEPAVWGVIPDFTTMITTGDTYSQNAQ